MEQWLHQIHFQDDPSSDENQFSYKDLLSEHHRRILKSGMVRTETTMVLKHIMWPHEMQYTSTGKPEVYEEMTDIASVVQGYIVIMSADNTSTRAKMLQHLEGLMGGIDLYGWECVHAYHGISLIIKWNRVVHVG